MANRDNHYEAAFEAYLRARCVPYVAIDETRRAQLGGDSLKSLDYIVHCREGRSWLVDVKGRRFPAGQQNKQYWKNWSTRDDLRAMAAWEGLFGQRFQALFVFAYAIAGDLSPLPADQLFEFRQKLYAFVGVRLGDYACHARPISAAWKTVALPSRRFREVARSFDEFLDVDVSAAREFDGAATVERLVTMYPSAAAIKPNADSVNASGILQCDPS